MKRYQFIHIEEYSLSRKNDKPDAVGVLKEARRELSHSKHIKVKKKIEEVYGVPLHRAEIELLNASYKKFNGKALRKDARILLAGVASFPIAFTDIEFDENKVKKWVAQTQEFLINKFGKNLKSIVYHKDETYPHIHFYCYNTDTMSIKNFHPGNILENQTHNASKKAKILAFKKGLIDFQNTYFEEVSKQFALERKADVESVRMNKTIKRHIDTLRQEAEKKDAEIANLNIKIAKSNSLAKQREELIGELKRENIRKSMEIDKLKVTLERLWEKALNRAKALLIRQQKINNIVDDDHFDGTYSSDLAP